MQYIYNQQYIRQTLPPFVKIIDKHVKNIDAPIFLRRIRPTLL